MTTADIQSRLTYWAGVYGVPPSLALSLAQHESGLNQAARGASGEVGILQIMPATAAGLHIDPYDPEANIEGGVRLLAQNYAQFGSWDYSLAAYNCGPSCAAKGPDAWPASTRSYVPTVLAGAGVLSTSYDRSATDSWGVPVLPTEASVLGAGEVSGMALLALAALALLVLVD